jgi:hypothetical protein
MAELVGHSGPADETAGAGVGGNDRHGKDKAPHGPSAEKVLLEKALGIGSFRRGTLSPHGNGKNENEVNRQR